MNLKKLQGILCVVVALSLMALAAWIGFIIATVDVGFWVNIWRFLIAVCFCTMAVISGAIGFIIIGDAEFDERLDRRTQEMRDKLNIK